MARLTPFISGLLVLIEGEEPEGIEPIAALPGARLATTISTEEIVSAAACSLLDGHGASRGRRRSLSG